MPEPGRLRLSTGAWEIFAAAAILAWRFRVYPFSGLWRDWVVILSLFWIFTVLAGRTRAWPWVTGAVMAGLLILYSQAQLPLTLALFGSER